MSKEDLPFWRQNQGAVKSRHDLSQSWGAGEASSAQLDKLHQSLSDASEVRKHNKESKLPLIQQPKAETFHSLSEKPSRKEKTSLTSHDDFLPLPQHSNNSQGCPKEKFNNNNT